MPLRRDDELCCTTRDTVYLHGACNSLITPLLSCGQSAISMKQSIGQASPRILISGDEFSSRMHCHPAIDPIIDTATSCGLLQAYTWRDMKAALVPGCLER